LRGSSAHARHFDHWPPCFAIDGLGRQLQDRSKQTDTRLPDRELGSVDGDGHPTNTGRKVVASQRALPPLVEPALGGERQRVGWNDDAPLEHASDVGSELG
jgi:hypothetical protein